MANRVGAPGLKMTVRVGGKTRTFASIRDAAKAFKIPYVTLYQRLFVMKWSKNKAVTTKVQRRKRKVKARRKK